MSSTLIDDLVKQREQEIQERDARAREEFQQASVKARELFASWLGLDIHDLLKPHAAETISQKDGAVVVQWKIGKNDDLRLSKMHIHFSTYSKSWRWVKVDESYTISDPTLALIQARERYENGILEEKERQVYKWMQALEWRRNRDRDVMENAYLSLCQEMPQESGRFSDMRSAWSLEEHEYLISVKMEQEERADLELRQAAYKNAYLEYLKAYLHAVNSNNAQMAEIQDVHNKGFDVYLLTYSFLGQDEDGEKSVDLGKVYVTSDKPEFGYYQTTQGQTIRFTNVVSIEKVTVRPIDNIPGTVRYDVPGAGWIYFRPGTYIPNDIHEYFLPIPEEPDYEGFGISALDRAKIIDEIERSNH